MSNVHPKPEFDRFEDLRPNRENEECASRLLLVMLGAAMMVFAIYSLAAICGAVVQPK
jgi:hypothetical protein